MNHNIWQKRKGWETRIIRSDAQSGTFVIWFFALLWNAVSSPVLFVIQEELQKGNISILIALLLPLTGLFLIYKAIQVTLEYRRFGIIEFEMDPYPGSIGGNIGGQLTINSPIKQLNTDFRIEVQCAYSSISGSGKSRSRKENILWAEEGTTKGKNQSKYVQLGFRFDIPEELPESDIEQQGDYHLWRLKVSAELPGTDLNRSYNIPVFKTREYSRLARNDLSKQSESLRKRQNEKSKAAIARRDFEATGLSRSVRVKITDRETQLFFPMFRNKVLTLFALIFGGGFGFATYGIISNFSGSTLSTTLSLLFSAPFALVGIIGAIAAVYLPLNNLSIYIRDKQVKVLRRLFILPIYYKKIGKDQIRNLTTKKSGSTGQGVSKIEHYKIFIHTLDGKRITIAEDIDGKALAEHFKNYLLQKITHS